MLVTRIRCEYREMPGLRLTVAEACRFFGIEERFCRAVLQQLLADGHLVQTNDGAFIERSALSETA